MEILKGRTNNNINNTNKLKKKLKDNNKLLIGLLIGFTLACTIVYASTTLFASNIVSYNNTTSGIQSSNVQGAIDELYACASNYSAYDTRLTTIEASHNSIFRGKNITSYYTDGTLYTRISDGTFDDLYVGDYIVKNNVNWRIAGFDIYYNKGDTALTKHHAVIVPDSNLTSAQMNTSNVTTGGYVGSAMYTTTLPSVLSTYITPVFGSHVIEYRNLLTKSVGTSLYNRWGTNSGASNGWDWYTRKLDLMNENQVYGSIVWSSSGYETGSDNVQFPLFKLKPEFVNKARSWYWLRNVASSSGFAFVHGGGAGTTTGASDSVGVRPCFYID